MPSDFLCLGCIGDVPLAALPAKPPLKGEVPAIGVRRGSSPTPRTVAAALSAAVTTTKQQETAPQLTAAYCMEEKPTRTAAALREKGSGEEGLLSEKPPPPQNLRLFPSSFREGARGRGLFYRKGPSLAKYNVITCTKARIACRRRSRRLARLGCRRRPSSGGDTPSRRERCAS